MPWKTKILIFPAWNKNRNTNRSTMQQKLIQFFLPQEAGASGNKIEKNRKSHALN